MGTHTADLVELYNMADNEYTVQNERKGSNQTPEEAIATTHRPAELPAEWTFTSRPNYDSVKMGRDPQDSLKTRKF